jgi:hypothetical protein
MPKSKPQPTVIQTNNLRRMLALNRNGVNELAIYIGSTNWFAEELVRREQIPHVVMGDRKVVDSQDVDEWLEEYKKSEAYRQAVAKWQAAYPDAKIPTVPMTDFEAQEFFKNVERDKDGALVGWDSDENRPITQEEAALPDSRAKKK